MIWTWICKNNATLCYRLPQALRLWRLITQLLAHSSRRRSPCTRLFPNRNNCSSCSCSRRNRTIQHSMPHSNNNSTRSLTPRRVVVRGLQQTGQGARPLVHRHPSPNGQSLCAVTPDSLRCEQGVCPTGPGGQCSVREGHVNACRSPNQNGCSAFESHAFRAEPFRLAKAP